MSAPMVIVESPYAGRGWWPTVRVPAMAKHTLRPRLRAGLSTERRSAICLTSALHPTQPGILRDATPTEMQRGIQAGLELAKRADKTVLYSDLGMSEGMRIGVEAARAAGRPVETRRLNGWS